MDETKIVVLLSGGLDSTVTLYWCKKRFDKIYPLYIDYGSSHKEKEFKCASDICIKNGFNLEVVKVASTIFKKSALTDKTQEMPSNLDDTINVVVPFRNLMMVTFAAAYADSVGATNIAISPTKEDYEVFRDCRRPFYDKLEQVLELGSKYEKKYQILTPFINEYKEGVIKEGIKLGVPFESTWTCYEKGTKPCGKCPSCQVRAKGFKELGIFDPLIS